MQRCSRTCGWYVIRAYALTKWCPTANTLWPHDQKVLELCRSYAQNKAQKHHSREFPGYWWLFRTQHLSRYSARLAEERRRRWTILIFDRFRFATLKQLLHIAITTADWGRFYKLLYVVLYASICSPVMILLWKCYWSCHLVFGPPYIWACYREPIILLFKVNVSPW